MPKKLTFGPSPVDATAEVKFTNLVNTISKWREITITNPAGGAASELRVHICAAAGQAAANMICSKTIPAGPYTETFYPGWVLTGVETLTCLTSAIDDVLIIAGSGEGDIA